MSESDNSIWNYLTSFHPRAIPLMSRPSYRRELVAWGFMPLMLSALQGGTIAVFLKLTFADVPGISPSQLNFAVSIVAAAKAVGHLSSFLWASVSRGKPKIQFLVTLQLTTAFIVAAFAFAPRSLFGLWMVTGLAIVAWTVWSAVSTLRTGVWRANYRLSYRPSVVGKFVTVHSLVVAAAGVVIGWSLDVNPMTYRFVFPALAILGIVGIFFYSRIPFRRERQHLETERSSDAQRRPSLSPMVIARVLKSDRWYRGYMACMFFMGFGNLMLHPILAIALTDEFNVGYQTGIAIATVIPLVCMTIAIPFWSRRLQLAHVIHYRAVHAWSFAVVSTLVLLGIAAHNIAFLYLAAIATGVGWGGGALAWSLGHQHFAPRDRDAEYMGVHITLTGIRGVIGPILGVQLYTWLSASGMQTQALLICFGICLMMNSLGACGFVLLSRFWSKSERVREAKKRAQEEDPVEQQESLCAAGSSAGR